ISVRKVDPDTMVKVHLYAHEVIVEALNLSMLRTMTNIPVPEVRQIVVNASSNTYLLVMEYIDNETLASCWGCLALIAKPQRLYRSALRKSTLDRAVACIEPFVTDYGAGPFASYDEMTRLQVGCVTCAFRCSSFRNSWPLVFSRQDL
ncbi:hypothetical protein F4604DRAFT_1584624, partial [Suillus subluteus]